MTRFGALACALVIALATALPCEGRTTLPLITARDDGAHPKAYAERWHLAAHLHDARGNRYDASVMFFRYALRGGAAFYPATLILVSERDHRAATATRAERDTFGLGRARTGALDVTVADWHLRGTRNADWRLRRYRLHGGSSQASLDLIATPHKAPIRFGSTSIAYTRLAVRGRVRIDGATADVSGAGWLDHDTGASVPSSHGERLALFDIALDDGRDFLLRFRNRGENTSLETGILIAKSGRISQLSPADVVIENPLHTHWISPQTGVRYPSLWEIMIRRAGFYEAVIPMVQAQEVVSDQGGSAFYDAAVDVERAPPPGGDPGVGYVEELGY